MRRLGLALIGALIVTGILFWLMQGLINASDSKPVIAETAATLDYIRVTEEPPPPPPPAIQRQLAPEKTVPRPQAAVLSIAQVRFPDRENPAPTLDLPVSVSGLLQSDGILTGVAGGDALAAFAQGQQGFTGQDLVPISSARPRYPRSAATRQIEGWVELIFVIGGEGRVRNVRVLDASPRGIFEDAAVHAMSRWLYAPYYVNGVPVAREATQLFRFRLDDIQELYLWDD